MPWRSRDRGSHPYFYRVTDSDEKFRRWGPNIPQLAQRHIEAAAREIRHRRFWRDLRDRALAIAVFLAVVAGLVGLLWAGIELVTWLTSGAWAVRSGGPFQPWY
jgi:hypothetical protein